MTCERVVLPDGTAAIVCGSFPRKYCACGRRATLECDWKVPERRSGTCDAPICSNCTLSPKPGKDICPDHQPAFHAWAERHQ